MRLLTKYSLWRIDLPTGFHHIPWLFKVHEVNWPRAQAPSGILQRT